MRGAMLFSLVPGTIGKQEPLQRSGKDFMVMKLLPSGIYHYRFIVDENLTYAPELPWECDDSGIAYNVLNVQDNVPEARESLSEFETPSSPSSSYGIEPLNMEDLSKPPPEIPPQLQLTLLHERFSTVDGQQSLPRPVHAVLNHLYLQNGHGQPVVALGSTHRFLHKYVTVVLYKPSQR
ncbi:SNF1-related protein kinase regulatory subunit beta-2 [Linum grandiflorum]